MRIRSRSKYLRDPSRGTDHDNLRRLGGHLKFHAHLLQQCGTLSTPVVMAFLFPLDCLCLRREPLGFPPPL